MDTKQALEILVQGVTVANKRGAFELPESKLIAEAVEVFTKKQDGTNTDAGTDDAAKEEVVSTSEEPATKG